MFVAYQRYSVTKSHTLTQWSIDELTLIRIEYNDIRNDEWI